MRSKAHTRTGSDHTPGDLFVRAPKRPQVLDLYRDWLALNRPIYAKYFNLVAMIFMALLIPFDFILFKDPLMFVRFRVIAILAFGISLVVLDRKKTPMELHHRDQIDTVLLVPGIFFNFLYCYFLYATRGGPYAIVLIANYMVIFLTTFFCHRFWREQYILNVAGIHGVLLVAAFRPEITKDCFLLVIFHISSLIAAFFFRREFVGSLHDRFNHLATLVPRKIAKYIAISHGKLSLEGLLEAKPRFTVCLCSDWRDYQKLAEEHDARYISNLFEGFYDIVFDELDRMIPEGNYYASWTADELFVIFYGESDDQEATKIEALRFAHSLATKISEEVRREFDVDLAYDIGLASGVGLLGLQGPSKLKKTTLTGKTPGTAARLESEAKAIRKKNSFKSPYPIILMDNALLETAQKNGLFKEFPFKTIKAETKNIKNQRFHMWRSRIQDTYLPSRDVDFYSLGVGSLN